MKTTLLSLLFIGILFLTGTASVPLCAAESGLPVGSLYAPASDFTGNWITAAKLPNPLVPNLWFAFRKTFDLNSIPEKAECRIACDSKYWLWLNGKMIVFEGALKRGPSPKDTYFDLIDLKPYLQEGKNTIAIQLWYFGKSGFSHLSSGKPGLLFDASHNGEKGLNLVSDGSWKGMLYSAVPEGLAVEDNKKRTSNIDKIPANWRSNTFGPFEVITADPQPNYRLAEWNIRFDARYDFKEDWRTPFFDDSSWPSVAECGVPGKSPVAPWGRLYQRLLPQWKNFGLRDYENQKDIPSVSSGDPIICVLPYNAQITPMLTVEAPAGQLIDIRMDNYNGGSEYNVRTEYITKEGVQTFETPGWMNGHKVIYSIPKGIIIKDLKYRETGYNAEISSAFSCNDPFFNLLWKKAVRTLYITMRDTYFDCPDRERAQWWGDAVNELGEAFYALDRNADLLPKKGFYELFRFQRETGEIFSPIPGIYKSELPAQMLATIGYYGQGTYARYSGDDKTRADLYPAMVKYLDLWKFDEKGLIVPRKGSWSWGDWGKDIDLRPLLNCWYYLAVKEAREIAVQIKSDADMKRWDGQMKSIEKAFNKEFWTGSDYRDPQYQGQSDDRTNAMAVLCGFPKPEWRPILREHFKKEKNASPYMEKYVLEAICVLGYPEDALARMKERFAKMVNHPEYSTLWEGWGIGSEGYGGGTINHAWSGGGLTCLAQYIVGLEPVEPAFKTFRIVPQLGSLKTVSLETPTHFGTIGIDLRKTEKGFSGDITVPKGTKCLFYLPGDYILPGGKADQTVYFGKYALITFKPGEHHFEYAPKK
ncbi:MAG: alpha-L-rhamnosidase C-terminal domain-containing protein [Planctomycetia bacterium]|nr:alpha-L-rhamnosidase C-terminal domain-containing protein [Planctomycetia bacterium]